MQVGFGSETANFHGPHQSLVFLLEDEQVAVGDQDQVNHFIDLLCEATFLLLRLSDPLLLPLQVTDFVYVGMQAGVQKLIIKICTLQFQSQVTDYSRSVTMCLNHHPIILVDIHAINHRYFKRKMFTEKPEPPLR